MTFNLSHLKNHNLRIKMQLIRLGYPALNFLLNFLGPALPVRLFHYIFCKNKGRQCCLGLTLILAQSKFDIIICYNQIMIFQKKNSSQVKKSTPRKSKYDFISLEKRKKLISLVTEDQFSIYRASREIGINNATAKVILKKYRSQGSIFVRKNQRSSFCDENKEKQVEQSQKMANTQAQIGHSNQPQFFHSQAQLICTTLPCYLYQTFFYSPSFF